MPLFELSWTWGDSTRGSWEIPVDQSSGAFSGTSADQSHAGFCEEGDLPSFAIRFSLQVLKQNYHLPNVWYKYLWTAFHLLWPIVLPVSWDAEHKSLRHELEGKSEPETPYWSQSGISPPKPGALLSDKVSVWHLGMSFSLASVEPFLSI